MADPVYTFSIELSAGSFTNLTTKVERASWAAALTDLFQAPRPRQALFELDNGNGQLSPRVNSMFVPGRALKLEATYSGSTFPLFFGRITEISLSPRVGERTTLIQATDDLDRVSRIRYDSRLFVGTSIRSVFTELMSLSSVRSFTSEEIVDVTGFAWYRERPALEAIDEIVKSGNYQFFVDGAGTYHLRDRYSGIFDSSINSYEVGEEMRTVYSQDSIINRMRAGAVSRKLATDIATLVVVESILTIPASSSIGFWLNYQDPREPSAITPVASIVSPVQSQDYYATSLETGSGADVTSGLTVATTHFSASAVNTITNNTGAAIYLSRLQIRGYPVLRVSDLAAQADVASSQTLYGVREVRLENSLIQNYLFLDSLAQTVVADRHVAHGRMRLGLRNEFPDVLFNQVGDTVSVVDSFSGSPLAWRIRAVSHELSLVSGLQHGAKYELEEFSQSPFLVLDHPVFGKLDSGRRLGI